MLLAHKLSIFHVVLRLGVGSVNLGNPLRESFGRSIDEFPSLNRVYTDGSEGFDEQLPMPLRLERLSATSSRYMTLNTVFLNCCLNFRCRF